MAISNSYNLSITRNDVIAGALRILGVIGEGDTPSSDQYTTGAEALNFLCKSWIAEGLPIWLVKEIWVEMDQGVDSYTIGSFASSGKASATVTGQFPMKVYQAWIRSRTAVTTGWVANTAKIAGDNIYPTVDNGFYYTCTTGGTTHATTEPTWPTVVDSTVTDGTVVWTAVAWEKLDIPMTVLSEQEYNVLGNKSGGGRPAQVFYKKLRTYGELKTFPVCGSEDDGKRLYILAQTPYADFDASSDEPDFPIEFSRALKFGLASDLTFDYGYPSKDRESLERRAEMYKSQAFGFEQEEESINFQIDIRNY